MATKFELSLPDWAIDALAAPPQLGDPTARMRWVIQLARTNFERDTGGPFAAAVFEQATGRVVSIGVNRVVPGRCSAAHAEVMALSLAQQAVGGHDLGGNAQRVRALIEDIDTVLATPVPEKKQAPPKLPQPPPAKGTSAKR